MGIRDEVLDELLSGYKQPEDLLGDDGLLKRLKKALIERALSAELTAHWGYEKDDPAGRGTGNIRNGYSKKTLKTEDGAFEIEVPRDRQGSFEPRLVPKGETRFDGFDDRILSLYARGMPASPIAALATQGRALPSERAQNSGCRCYKGGTREALSTIAVRHRDGTVRVASLDAPYAHCGLDAADHALRSQPPRSVCCQ